MVATDVAFVTGQVLLQHQSSRGIELVIGHVYIYVSSLFKDSLYSNACSLSGKRLREDTSSRITLHVHTC